MDEQPALTAEELDRSENPEYPIEIGFGRHIVVRVPDAPTLCVEGVLPFPLLEHVVANIITKMEPTEEGAKAAMQDPAFVEFVNRWCCAVAVRPRLTLEPPAEGEDALHISKLRFPTRMTIVNATFMGFRAPARAAEFRDVGEGGEHRESGEDLGVPAVAVDRDEAGSASDRPRPRPRASAQARRPRGH